MASGCVISVNKAVVVAAGVWSGEFLDARDDGDAGAESENDRARPRPWRRVFAPRRGHLLEVRRRDDSDSPALRHGVMELSYARHYDATAAALSWRRSSSATATATEKEKAGTASADSFAPSAADEELGVVFTATPSDSTGKTLLLGSSREEGGRPGGGNGGGSGSSGSSGSGSEGYSSGSDSEEAVTADPLLDLSTGDSAARSASRPSAEVVGAILRRAALFLPELAGVDWSSSVAAAAASSPVRVGLRPASSSGMPVVGRVLSFGGSLSSAVSSSSSSSSFSSSASSPASNSASNSNVVVAAGHEGSGLTLAPATAALIARLVAGEPERALPSFYSALRPERALEAARRMGRRRGGLR